MPTLECSYQIPTLPPSIDIETVDVYRALASANRSLAELKGIATSIPNQGILINSLSLQEARASSAIENIVTTQDDLFKGVMQLNKNISGPSKEVALYRDAVYLGWKNLNENNGIITNRSLIEQFQLLKGIETGFRTTGGTVLRNNNGETVYVPPQTEGEISQQMSNLSEFINLDEKSDLDPLIKMAIIHHQFESIHPFSDGNGRVGRMLNVLYLTKVGLLDTPILYLSRYITANKSLYYRYLQNIRDTKTESETNEAWMDWILYVLKAVEETSETSITIVKEIRQQMAVMKSEVRDGALSKIYSQDLINNLFRHPYTRIEFIQNDLSVTRKTATKYLDELSEAGILKKLSEGRNNYYVNHKLVDLFVSVSVE